MDINLASNDGDVLACYPVMRELRPDIAEDAFLQCVQQQRQQGYRLAFISDNGMIVSVAGFRISNNLAWGHFLYVDDLVTAGSSRSKGYGSAMLAWLRDYARDQGCGQLHLDSGTQRIDAHRFYEREGVTTTGKHFAQVLGE